MADPYRWLEEETPEVRSWEERQHLLTNQILESWPDRERLRQGIYQSLSENNPHLPVFSGQCVFQVERLAGQQHPVLFVTDQESEKRRILINPNNMSEQTEIDWFYLLPMKRM
jgi:prolyl oligopeptidase